jgi:TadE-like protein
LVEAALVIPLLFTVLFGTMEFAWFLKDRMTVNNAALESARELSSSASNGDADYNAVVRANKTLSALGKTAKTIVVFKATSTNGAGATVPSSCLTATARARGGVRNVCNVYGSPHIYDPLGQLSIDVTQFGHSVLDPFATSTKLDRFYPARTRSDKKSAAEYVGVYIEVEYHPLTGVLRNSRLISATSVSPIEARRA